jgi:uncharacterized protein YbaP (TraB family)
MYYGVEGTNLRVLGSMHLFPVEHTNMPSWVWDGFNWCDELVFEADNHHQDLGKVAISQGGPTVKEIMSRKLWRRVNSLWGKQKGLFALKLWPIMAGLESKLWKQFPGVEPQFRDRLLTKPKPLTFLETPQMMARAFESVPDCEYLKMIGFMVDSVVLLQTASLRCYNEWIHGRIDELQRSVLDGPMEKFPFYRKGLFLERNQNWMNNIRPLFNSPRKILLVVGAGHLFGEGGLENLFSEENHKLFPLMDKEQILEQGKPR